MNKVDEGDILIRLKMLVMITAKISPAMTTDVDRRWRREREVGGPGSCGVREGVEGRENEE